MIAQESTPQQVIDMVGLHINYLINGNLTNRNIIKKPKIPSSNWGRSNAITYRPVVSKFNAFIY